MLYRVFPAGVLKLSKITFKPKYHRSAHWKQSEQTKSDGSLLNRSADGLIHSEQAASFRATLPRQNCHTSSHVVTKARVADVNLPWDK